ncbi:Protein of unknown function [Cotesia congregata]|uniref:Uncharacterized protein n=1 Tax=Cotesia congregata TaxID=51543 RepID=A0A8J2H9R2_COTCN|nr:Protein of unknown function [Cotesia congregata]
MSDTTLPFELVICKSEIDDEHENENPVVDDDNRQDSLAELPIDIEEIKIEEPDFSPISKKKPPKRKVKAELKSKIRRKVSRRKPKAENERPYAYDPSIK